MLARGPPPPPPAQHGTLYWPWPWMPLVDGDKQWAAMEAYTRVSFAVFSTLWKIISINKKMLTAEATRYPTQTVSNLMSTV
jgi:hypothetical protein